MKTLLSFTLLLSSLLAAGMLAGPAEAENWPHWRGPSYNSVSQAEGLPASFSKDDGIAWRLALPGPGPSTPVIWGERIFLTSAEGDDIVLMAVSKSGEVQWKQTVGKENYDARQGESNAAAPSPVTDGTHVWALTGTGEMAAFTVEGKEVWRVDLQERYGDFQYFFGHSSSPLVTDGKVFIQLLHSGQQLLVALDAATGKELWQHKRASEAEKESLHSYASPLPFGDQILVHGSDVLTAHQAADGKELWRVKGLNDPERYDPTLRFVATPTVAGDLVVVPSAKNGPVVALKPDKASGDVTGKAGVEVWRLDRGTPDVASPLVVDGLIYLVQSNGALVVHDAKDGSTVYQTRTHEARHRASPVYADGKIYLTASDGTVTAVKPGREYEVLGTSDLGERIHASPAVAGDTLYLRTYEALYAIGGKAAAKKADAKAPKAGR